MAGTNTHLTYIPQSGLEIPCRLIFKGKRKDTGNIKLLPLKSLHQKCITDEVETKNELVNVEECSKSIDCTEVETIKEVVNVEKCSEPIDCAANKGDIVLTTNSDHTWVQANKWALALADKETLLTYGSLLTDKYINYAQVLLQNQFTNVTGLQSTLLQYKPLLKK